MRLLILCLLSSLAMAQEFEAASIKFRPVPSNPADRVYPGEVVGGPGSSDPTHMTWKALFLQNMVQAAYGVPLSQVKGPTDVLFDFAVLVPPGATRGQVMLMWRNLLISRFGMKAHVEKRELDADELVVSPRGHKLKENREGTAEYKTSVAADGSFVLTAHAHPLWLLVNVLTGRRSHQVVDRTGLTSKYDFTFTTARQTGAPGADDTLEYDLQEQLGLRLVKGKAMQDHVVIDSIERMPTEN